MAMNSFPDSESLSDSEDNKDQARTAVNNSAENVPENPTIAVIALEA